MHRVAVVLFCIGLFGAPILRAGTAPFPIPKDAKGMAVASQALAAMGGSSALSSYQDSEATGTLTVYTMNPAVKYPITLKSKGTHETRAELQEPDGTTVRIVNQGQGVMERASGTVLQLSMNNILAERVSHVPLLSILAEYQNSNIGVQYKGTAQVNGQNESLIALSYVPTTDAIQGPIFLSMTQTFFYVNQSSGLVDKIQYTDYSETDSNATQKIELYFSNYQAVNAILVPFHQTTFTDGNLDSDLTLSAISFNVGLPDSDFALPQ